MRIVVKYAREGAAKYISHLDMQRAFGRAIRRAGIGAEYSQGFNPHIVMSFASPLSLGYATQADYMEFCAAEGENAETVRDRLNAALPPDIRVAEAFSTGENGKKLMSLNDSALWRVTFAATNRADCDKIKRAADKIGKSVSFVTDDRKGRPVDVVPLIVKLDAARAPVLATLKNAPNGALNPAVLAEALLREAELDAPYEICRLECYGKIGGTVLPFSALRE